MGGLSAISALEVQPFGGQAKFDFDVALVTFTAALAKRAGSVFAAAPIVQGDANNADALADDKLYLSRGSQISGNFYANLDPNQGTVLLWWKPEYSSADLSGSGDHHLWQFESDIKLRYSYDNNRFEFTAHRTNNVSMAITAGTTYCIICRWDCTNNLDGTNYLSVSVDDSHTFNGTIPAVQTPSSLLLLGGNYTAGLNTLASNGIIEGLTIYRRPLWDGAYGINVGNGDEIALISAGVDPCLVTGSWDVTFCLPTTGSVGALATGTGEAWSHPHGSNLIPGNSNAGGFMLDGTYTNDGWADEGTPTAVAALAAAEKIFPGGYKVTSDAANEGIYQDITVSAGDDVVIHALGHSDGTSVPKVILYDQDNSAEIASLTGANTSTRTAPNVFEFAGEAPAGCTTIRVKLVNTSANAGDVTYWHQVVVHANLWDDPGMEAGTAPTNVGTPTTSAQDAGQAHTDTNSWKVVADAADEGIKRAITTTSGKFYHVTAWVYADTAGTVDMEGPTLQDGSTTKATTATVDAWERLEFVFRATAASTDLQFTSNAAQTFYVDDVAVVELDDVSLTAIPATEANSTETSGLRVDGRDSCSQPITGLKAQSGHIRFKWTPRHHAADLVKFAEASNPQIARARYNGSNEIILRASAANTIALHIGVAAIGTTAAWDCTGAIVAGTTYDMEIKYTATTCKLFVDGTLRATATPAAGIDFGANIPTTIYWGADHNAANAGDATFAAP